MTAEFPHDLNKPVKRKLLIPGKKKASATQGSLEGHIVTARVQEAIDSLTIPPDTRTGTFSRKPQQCTLYIPVFEEMSEPTPLRKKAGRPALQLNKNEIEARFDIPQQLAARQLGVSLSGLKKECRKFGILQWPYKRSSYTSNGRSTIGSNAPLCDSSWRLIPRAAEKSNTPSWCAHSIKDATCSVPEPISNHTRCLDAEDPFLNSNWERPRSAGGLPSFESNLPPYRASGQARALENASWWQEGSGSCADKSDATRPNCAMPLHNVRACPTMMFDDEDAVSTHQQRTNGHTARWPEHVSPRSAGGHPYDPEPAIHMSWDDRLRFLLSVPATINLAEDRDFIADVEAQAISGYLEGLAVEATACLDSFPPPQ